MIYLLGISIAFFLGLLLLSKKGKTQADIILTCWLFLIGIHLLLFYLYFSKLYFQYPNLLGINIPFPLVHGPMLFLYTASLTRQFTSLKKMLWLHFIPATLCYLYLISFFKLPAAQKIYIFQNKGLGFEKFQAVNMIAMMASGITYVIWSIILLQNHKKNIISEFSYNEKINLKWLQYLIYGTSFIWILVFAKDEILFAGVVLFVLFIGYFGIKQVGIFTINKEEIAEAPEFLKPYTINEAQPVISVLSVSALVKKKYIKSGLTMEMAEALESRLTTLMDTEKIYKESDLSLSDLAGRLDTLPNYLSQVINEKKGKSFYDYINMLRVEEFKKLISIPENRKYTIMSLSYDCGFNSKSSFNKNFKKATGLSPTDYLNSLNINTI